MLISTVAATSSSSPIQISINNTALAAAVMYVVPVGRKFVGYIGNITAGNRTQINAAFVSTYQGNATSVISAGALWTYTLLAGTVIKEVTASSSYIIGVESNE